MILIADGGATKTDWCLLDKHSNNAKFFKTQGINPQVQSLPWINKMLQKEIPSTVQELPLNEIYYYGAGCSSEHFNNKIEHALSETFNASLINVDHDMMGAVRALCSNKPGIACILGTGSNSIYFNGKKLIKKSDALGFILGDEGSGAHIGKQLIIAYLYNQLPNELMQYYSNELKLTKDIILTKVYSLPNPNRYLASFCGSLEQFRTHPYIEDLLESSFESFFNRHVLIYKESKKLPIHFTGSIAYFYHDVLEKICSKHGLQLGSIIQQPILNLREYHQNT